MSIKQRIELKPVVFEWIVFMIHAPNVMGLAFLKMALRAYIVLPAIALDVQFMDKRY